MKTPPAILLNQALYAARLPRKMREWAFCILHVRGIDYALATVRGWQGQEEETEPCLSSQP